MCEFLSGYQGRRLSPSTYRNWEQRVSDVPGWVDRALTGEILMQGFSFSEFAELDRLARERGDGSTAHCIAVDLVRRGIHEAVFKGKSGR
jgi:hypothetical protein